MHIPPSKAYSIFRKSFHFCSVLVTPSSPLKRKTVLHYTTFFVFFLFRQIVRSVFKLFLNSCQAKLLTHTAPTPHFLARRSALSVVCVRSGKQEVHFSFWKKKVCWQHCSVGRKLARINNKRKRGKSLRKRIKLFFVCDFFFSFCCNSRKWCKTWLAFDGENVLREKFIV